MKQRLLFLQLPLLDNDLKAARENLRLAGVYLGNTLARGDERLFYRPLNLPETCAELDDAHLLAEIARAQPGVIAATCYLWNIERTLALLARVRARLPGLRVILGGPEVARAHPFLFRSRLPDVAVTGEGEGVFSAILAALRLGQTTDFANVAWKTGHGYRWGRRPPPELPLRDCLPNPAGRYYRPDANGLAYMETSRGCPRRCAYCRYHHQRAGVSFLTADETMARVRAFQRQGAREIRFIDPTFNSNPAFEEIVRRLAAWNSRRRLKFFAEIYADRITPRQAGLLAAANFKEIEVGVQSRDPRVLRLIRRPTRRADLERGIRALLARNIRVTLDIMAGLPGQAAGEIRSSVAWAERLKGASVQCLQTLLLPGTDLRRQRKRWKLVAGDAPPYAVAATSTISAPRMRALLACLQAQMGVVADCPTRRFVGRVLPDLFPEQVHLPPLPERWPRHAPGRATRRAIVFHGPDLFACRAHLAQFIHTAVSREGHILWQFVLALEGAEPLDLIEGLIAGLRRFPPHLNDRWVLLDTGGRMAARRIMLRLQPRRRYDPGWIKAADALLRSAFY